MGDCWDDGWKRPALGKLSRGRIRPNHVVGVPQEWQQASHFPKSNRCRLVGTGCHLVWRLHGWAPVDGYIEGVKRRHVHCAVFDGEELVSFLEIQQIKNTDADLLPREFILTLDDESAELGELGVAVTQAMARAGRDFVEAGEVFTEVHSLFITSSQRGRMVWVPAIHRILEILYKKSNGDADSMLAVLKPLPLDVWSFRSERNRAARWREEEPPDPDEAEERNFERRRRALIRLYGQKLGFELLPEMDWMWSEVV